MKYFAYKRRKNYTTVNYAAMLVDDPSRLPTREWNGMYKEGSPVYEEAAPWERIGEFDENNSPSWFNKSAAQKPLADVGFFRVDQTEPA